MRLGSRREDVRLFGGWGGTNIIEIISEVDKSMNKGLISEDRSKPISEAEHWRSRDMEEQTEKRDG